MTIYTGLIVVGVLILLIILIKLAKDLVVINCLILATDLNELWVKELLAQNGKIRMGGNGSPIQTWYWTINSLDLVREIQSKKPGFFLGAAVDLKMNNNDVLKIVANLLLYRVQFSARTANDNFITYSINLLEKDCS